MQNTGFYETTFKKQAVFLPMRLMRGLHLFYLETFSHAHVLLSYNVSNGA